MGKEALNERGLEVQSHGASPLFWEPLPAPHPQRRGKGDGRPPAAPARGGPAPGQPGPGRGAREAGHGPEAK